MISIRRPLAAVLIPLLLLSCCIAMPISSARAQAPAPVHKSWVQRHPTATGLGAGVATHHMLKVSAARKKREHQKLNWAERHPTLSGLGVGVATHHYIKKHTPH